ncbi:cytochrome c biogenesis CcdA family protein [Micromonospora aurantiaca (nom. illeg.)]|uniref:cytochrome c biogenesis CcdA family protein n=1 Tax=Micromonospora aurantiaca (nom. illeg.) TaxID=47850 RepID=UPI001656D8CE|nr:cytochrome c biogenesis CcdA family protein [Micromonospora aurantiaca]MBC9003666.1 cytochrome c biogenesis protein CcdA [Micromonospora aurantiaca]
MGERFATIASSGPLLLAMAVAAAAGLVSFLSPCVLPLVPGYLSYVTGLAGADLDAAARPAQTGAVGTVLVKARQRARRRVVTGTLGFIAGFAVVFVTVAVAFNAAGRALVTNARTIEIAAGALTVLLGAGYLGAFPLLQRQVRASRLPAAGVASAPVLGATFGLSWTPCVSPTLGAVLGLAAVESTAGRATVLALAYCAGLGLPFLLVGLGLRHAMALIGFVRRHQRWVTRVGGALLVAIGAALLTGVWGELMNWLRATVGPGQIGI